MCKGRNKASTPHSDCWFFLSNTIARRSPSREEKEACPVNTPKSKTRASMNMYLAKTSKEPLLKSNNFKQDHLDFIGSVFIYFNY